MNVPGSDPTGTENISSGMETLTRAQIRANQLRILYIVFFFFTDFLSKLKTVHEI